MPLWIKKGLDINYIAEMLRGGAAGHNALQDYIYEETGRQMTEGDWEEAMSAPSLNWEGDNPEWIATVDNRVYEIVHYTGPDFNYYGLSCDTLEGNHLKSYTGPDLLSLAGLAWNIENKIDDPNILARRIKDYFPS
jgi:hypothetical protein